MLVQRERAIRTQTTECFQSASTLLVMIVLLDVKALASGWFQVGEGKTQMSLECFGTKM